METFRIDISVKDIEQNQKLQGIMKKVLKVIKSMENREQIQATRRYIDLWYKKYGDNHKGLIEIYFKSKSNEVK